MPRGKSVIGFRIEVIIEPDETGFHAYCPALKGLHTFGQTEEEALQNVRDAAIAYLQSSIKHGDPIPIGFSIHEAGEKPSFRIKSTTRRIEELMVACAT